jgi:hypothetical protein
MLHPLHMLVNIPPLALPRHREARLEEPTQHEFELELEYRQLLAQLQIVWNNGDSALRRAVLNDLASILTHK